MTRLIFAILALVAAFSFAQAEEKCDKCDLQKHARPRELKPIVWAIDDWNRNWKLGVIFECNVGAGKLLVSAINLKEMSQYAYQEGEKRSVNDGIHLCLRGQAWCSSHAPKS